MDKEHKFKIGDWVFKKEREPFRIREYGKFGYNPNEPKEEYIPYTSENDYELFTTAHAEDFQSLFHPFDKVLVRNKGSRWIPAFFARESPVGLKRFQTIDLKWYEECRFYDDSLENECFTFGDTH